MEGAATISFAIFPDSTFIAMQIPERIDGSLKHRPRHSSQFCGLMLRVSGGCVTGLSKSNIPVRIWPVQNGSLNAEEKTFDTLRGGGLRIERGRKRSEWAQAEVCTRGSER